MFAYIAPVRLKLAAIELQTLGNTRVLGYIRRQQFTVKF
jgi:hypothetical protein